MDKTNKNGLPVKANVSIVLMDPWQITDPWKITERGILNQKTVRYKNSRWYHVQPLLKAHILGSMTQIGVNSNYSVKGFSQALWSYIALRGIKQTVP